MKDLIYNVKPVIAYLEQKFEYDDQIKGLKIKGEISNFKKRKNNKTNQEFHYFNLVEDDVYIRCYAYGDAINYTKDLNDGDLAIVCGNIELYKRETVVEINVKMVEFESESERLKRLNLLREKLEKEGLFTNKKRIPTHPENIGIITAKDSAAHNDLKDTLGRTPYVKYKIYDSLMQGDNAKELIIEQLLKADLANHDVLILSRGGGSKFDLEIFNDEDICRTIAKLKTPIITAIGHSIDKFIIDDIADDFAITPTDAIKKVLKNMIKEVLEKELNFYQIVIKTNLKNKLKIKQNEINGIKERIILLNPKNKIKEKVNKINEEKNIIPNLLKEKILKAKVALKYITENIKENIKNLLQKRQETITNKLNIIEVLSPKTTLTRGFSYLLKGDKVINSVNGIKVKDTLNIKVKDGTIRAVVEEVKHE